MRVVINFPGINPYSAPFLQTIEMPANVGEDGKLTFVMTKECLEDLVKIGQSNGMSIWIRD